jgi:hypothetical protein
MNDSITGCPCIRCFRSLDGQVHARTVLRISAGWPHHADAVGLDGGGSSRRCPRS